MSSAFEEFNAKRRNAIEDGDEQFTHNGKAYFRGLTDNGMVVFRGEGRDSYRGSKKRRRRKSKKKSGGGKKKKKSRRRSRRY